MDSGKRLGGDVLARERAVFAVTPAEATGTSFIMQLVGLDAIALGVEAVELPAFLDQVRRDIAHVSPLIASTNSKALP
jgi:hypothetical protein